MCLFRGSVEAAGLPFGASGARSNVPRRAAGALAVMSRIVARMSRVTPGQTAGIQGGRDRGLCIGAAGGDRTAPTFRYIGPRPSDTRLVGPSLHSRWMGLQSLRMCVTDGALVGPPSALDSTFAHRVRSETVASRHVAWRHDDFLHRAAVDVLHDLCRAHRRRAGRRGRWRSRSSGS
jgi:hypothetical protein